MGTNAPSSRPSLELNMSLFGGSPAPPSKKTRTNEQSAAEGAVVMEREPMTPQPAPLAQEALLKESMQWIRELETVRDDLHMLSVRNAVLLDSLSIAGATEILLSEEDQDGDE